MTIRRDRVGVLRVKIRDRDGDDRLSNFDRHQLRVMHIADVLVWVIGHQRDEIAARVLAIIRLRKWQGVDVFAGEKLRLHK